MGQIADWLNGKSTKPKPEDIKPRPPESVTVLIAGMRVNVVTLQSQNNPRVFTVYGPTELGSFEDVPSLWLTNQHPDTVVRLALYRLANGRYEFAPLPAVVLRTEQEPSRVAG